MASSSSKLSYADLELTRKRNNAPVCNTTLAVTYSEVKAATPNYEEVTGQQASQHLSGENHQLTPVSSHGVYTGINKEQLDSNLNPTPIYEEAISTKQGMIAQSTAGGTNEKEVEMSIKKIIYVIVAVMVLMFVIVASLAICCGFVFSEMESLKSNLDSSNRSLQVHTNVVKDLIQSYMQLNTSLSALGKDIEDTLNDTVTVERYEVLVELTSQVLNTLSSLGQPSAPAASCAALLSFHPSSPSGYYWVRASNGSAVRVYCDMTLSCGGVTEGWTRVAYLNLTDGSSTQCPPTLPLRDSSQLCAIDSSSVIICSSTSFNSRDVLYSSVCGRVTAYQGGSPQAFNTDSDIDSPYVSGISLTHGSPRQHIWTFAAASNETHNNCPCSSSSNSNIPSFVGSDYFCDGIDPYTTVGLFELSSPLWDGSDCLPTNRCCSFNNPPWFYRQLSQPTTDSIEMRVCRNEARANIGIETLELYVQ